MAADSRLERALALWLQHRAAATCSDAEFLERNRELQDLLEPMTAGESVVEPAEPEPPYGEFASGEPPATRPGGFGDYVVLGELGRGGMGVVYEARQLSLDRRVALKVVAPSAMLSLSALTRIRREARILAQLDHPAIVKVLAVLDGDTAGYAMERIDGDSIDARPRGARDQVELVARIADALHHAHEQGVVHRDVKPQNILVRSDGAPVLVDFGLAREAEQASLTGSGMVGTPYYVSPEQIRGDEVDARSDVYSLGVTLYELLTGRRPFLGGSVEAVLAAIERGEPPDPRRASPELSRDLAAIVLKAISNEPARRYATAREFAADLRNWSSGRAVVARTPSRMSRAWRWCRREPWRAAAIAVLAVGVPAAAGVLGFIAAKRPLWQAAEARAAADACDDLCADGSLDLLARDRDGARESFAAALALDPTSLEARAGLALAQPDLQRSIEVLERDSATLAASPGLTALRDDLRAGRAGIDREPVDDLDAFVTGLRTLGREKVVGFDRVSRTVDHRERQRRATNALSVMARRSSRPRLLHYVLLAHAAANAIDARAGREAAETLRGLWPDSERARYAEAVARTTFDRDGARAAMQARCEQRPDDWIAWSNLMQLEQSAGALDAALPAARRVAELRPDDAIAHASVATLLVALGRDEEALSEWQRTIALDPDDVVALAELAVADLKGGDVDAAVRRLDAAIAIEPELAIAHCNLGLARRRRGDFDAAIAAFERARDLDPRLEAAHRNLLFSLARRGDHAAVRAEHERWVALFPNVPGAWLDYASWLVDPRTPDAERDPTLGLLAALRGLAAARAADVDAFVAVARAHLARGDAAAADSVFAAARAALPARAADLDQARTKLGERAR